MDFYTTHAYFTESKEKSMRDQSDKDFNILNVLRVSVQCAYVEQHLDAEYLSNVFLPFSLVHAHTYPHDQQTYWENTTTKQKRKEKQRVTLRKG